MQSKFKTLIACSVILSLTACAIGPVLVPKGNFANEQQVTLDRDWNDVTKLYVNSKSHVKLLTLDGILLNRLYISSGLTPNDPLLVGALGDSSAHVAPRSSANMSLTEHMDYVSRALSEADFIKIETKSPKPVTISGQRGIRFEIFAKTKDGLNMRGLGQAVSKNSKNYYIIYIAPEEHYYNANYNNVVAALDSEVIN